MLKTTILIVAIGFLVAKADEPLPLFLNTEDVGYRKVVGQAPAPESTVDRADFAKLFDYQRERTKEDCTRAAVAVRVNLDTFFGPQYGPLSVDEVTRWSEFFEIVRRETNFYVQKAKREQGRPRPYVANAEVLPCVPLEQSLAYPSGHAAIAQVFGELLMDMFPDRAVAIERRMREIGEDRVLAGVHHPSDIQAGFRMGQMIYAQLMQSHSFRSAMERATRARLSFTCDYIEFHVRDGVGAPLHSIRELDLTYNIPALSVAGYQMENLDYASALTSQSKGVRLLRNFTEPSYRHPDEYNRVHEDYGVCVVRFI